MSLTIDIFYRDAPPSFRETEHPRGGSGSGKGGQFVRKGEGGGAGTSRAPQPSREGGRGNAPAGGAGGPEEAKTPIAAFVAKHLAAGTSAAEVAEKLKSVTGAHKNPDYINRMYRQLEKKHGLSSGSLGKAEGKTAPGKRAEEKPEPEKKAAPERKPEPEPAPEPAKKRDKPTLPPDSPEGGFTQKIQSMGESKILNRQRKLAEIKGLRHFDPKHADAWIDYLTPPTPGFITKAVQGKHNANEKEFHRTAWSFATPEMGDIIANTPPINRVTSPGKVGNAHYDFSPHNIAMNNMSGGPGPKGGKSAEATWRHEFAHAIDWTQGMTDLPPYKRNRSYQYHDVLVEEGNALVQSQDKELDVPESREESKRVVEKAGLAWEDIEEFSKSANLPGMTRSAIIGTLATGQAAKHIGRLSISEDDRSQLYDFVGAVTMNKLGYGHSTQYYQKSPHYRTAEAFAQYVSLTQSEGGKVYKAILHALAPKLCAGFADMLKVAATKKGVHK